MNSPTVSFLIAAFKGLGDICGGYDGIVLCDVSADESGVTLCLSRSVSIGCGDYEDEAHSIHFTWTELTSLDNLRELATTRWDEAKRHDDAARERHRLEQAAEEAAKCKRRRAASKGARKRRELATLACLKARYEGV